MDNNIPRSVTHLLRDRGEDAVEVRDVLGQDAPDDAVVAFAAVQGRWLVTHDRGCAANAHRKSVPHLWLRTREVDDLERVRAELEVIADALDSGALRVVLFRGSVRLGDVADR